MRLPADGHSATFTRIGFSLTLTLALGACGIGGGGGDHVALAAPLTGPQADYPVVVGAPYTVSGVAYAPEDVLNYDEVGFVAVDQAGSGISAAHHTLPLPSYVEVTSLDTGRTILVRVERRGPMNGTDLLALSPAALAELQAAPGAPIRVRRVNPPEDHRALLRAGQPAPLRMDTPMPLVEVLKRRLPSNGSAPLHSAAPQLASSTQAAAPVTVPVSSRPQPIATIPLPPSAIQVATVPPLPRLELRRGSAPTSTPPSSPRVTTAPTATPSAPPRPAVARAEDGFVVQAAAFSTSDRAQSAARVLGGEVSRAGQYWRVRTGPFATRDEAEASLAKVRAAGYRDARIFTNG
jgi:rare lipoprotein A